MRPSQLPYNLHNVCLVVQMPHCIHIALLFVIKTQVPKLFPVRNMLVEDHFKVATVAQPHARYLAFLLIISITIL